MDGWCEIGLQYLLVLRAMAALDQLLRLPPKGGAVRGLPTQTPQVLLCQPNRCQEPLLREHRESQGSTSDVLHILLWWSQLLDHDGQGRARLCDTVGDAGWDISIKEQLHTKARRNAVKKHCLSFKISNFPPPFNASKMTISFLII